MKIAPHQTVKIKIGKEQLSGVTVPDNRSIILGRNITDSVLVSVQLFPGKKGRRVLDVPAKDVIIA